MHTFKNLYEQIFDFDNLYQAYLSSRKGKRYRDQVLLFTSNLEDNLIQIQNELIYQTYKVGRYHEFYVCEPKKRLVMALPYRDRVVQWAVYRVINPLISKPFIADSYACIQGRGAQAAIKKLQYWLKMEEKQDNKLYYLKLDVSKFFYRVNHEVLLNILRCKFDSDSRLMWLFDVIINSEDTPFGLPLGCNPGETERIYDTGMPIGNLTSQMFANLYLNELDQFAKRQLQIHCYIRYMDDIIILSHDKAELHRDKLEIEEFLNTRLLLNLNKKTAIRPTSLGIEYVGYKVWSTHIKLRKSTALKMKRRLKFVRKQYEQGEMPLEKVSETMNSYFGIMRHCNSYNLRKKLSDTYILQRKD
nr:reverse transcriptase domain-containing protein [uncultured Caproiciproducens sp.]